MIERQALENVYSEADVEYRLNIAQSVLSSLSNLWTDRIPISEERLKYVVCSFNLSQLDYCNFVTFTLWGISFKKLLCLSQATRFTTH